MNFRHIEVFFAVMTSGSITQAAKLLNVSQPSVTTTIKHAEQRLGFALFIRESGRLIPTEEARVLFEEVTRAHESLEVVRHLAEKMRDGRSGHVRIAATNTLSMAILPDVLHDFSNTHPNYSYSIHTLTTKEVMSKLDETKGNYHLGFTHVSGVSGLNYRSLGETSLVCLVPKNWGMENFDFAQLADKPFIALYDQTPLASLFNKHMAEHSFKPSTSMNVHSHILAGNLVNKDLGYTVLDCLTVHYLREHHLLENTSIFSLDDELKLPIMAVYPANRSISDPANHFIVSFESALQKILSEIRAQKYTQFCT